MKIHLNQKKWWLNCYIGELELSLTGFFLFPAKKKKTCTKRGGGGGGGWINSPSNKRNSELNVKAHTRLTHTFNVELATSISHKKANPTLKEMMMLPLSQSSASALD